MKIFLPLIITFTSFQICSAQCEIKTIERPDGNTIKYFNPKPVIQKTDYEVGISIYKNVTTDILMVNVSLLFKRGVPQKLSENLIIQTSGQKGISLEPIVSELVEMNNRKVAIGLYKLDESSVIELSNHALKSVFVTIGGNILGSTVTQSPNLLANQINCMFSSNLVKNLTQNLKDDSESVDSLDIFDIIEASKDKTTIDRRANIPSTDIEVPTDFGKSKYDKNFYPDAELNKDGSGMKLQEAIEENRREGLDKDITTFSYYLLALIFISIIGFILYIQKKESKNKNNRKERY